jgi:Arc/MetJ-type ribon-helix-helix transcriptional regulator
MKICTINIPDQYLDCLEILVTLGYYPSRSEAVRVAIKQFLNSEPIMMDSMMKETFEEMKKIQMNSMINMGGT